MNLLSQIREQLGFSPFIKIDPNTQQLTQKGDSKQLMGQSAITSVLTAVYQLSRTNEGFGMLRNKENNVSWSETLFGEEANKVTESIVSFSGQNEEIVNSTIEDAGNTVWNLSTKELGSKLDYEHFGKFISSVRNDLLIYLPPQLHLGKILHDSSLDDRTNKMGGPVSGFLHRIEKIFSDPQDHPERLDNF